MFWRHLTMFNFPFWRSCVIFGPKLCQMDSLTVLATHLRNEPSLSPDEVALICSYFEPLELEKEEPLFVAGQKFSKLVFIAEGILRIFIIDSAGNEVVKSFLEANDFFEDLDSIDHGNPSVLNISAVTHSNLLILTKAGSEELINKLPKWDYLSKKGAMDAMRTALRQQEFLRLGDSTSQYQYFVQNFPNLAKHVPLKYIASYLHITQSSLSRVRRQGW